MLVPETQDRPTEKEFLDADFEEFSNTGGEWETVPTNWYDLVIEDLTSREKTDNKLRSELALKKADHPDATLESIDRFQWVWTLRIDTGDYAGLSIVVKTSRSFHEKSHAGKLAAAALGLKKWDRDAARAIAQAAGKSGTGVLMGRKLRGSVTEDPDAQGRMWNNCKEFEPWQPPRPRQQRAPQAPQGTPAVKPVVVDELSDPEWVIDEE